jgi:FtsZ-interacting cell division protein ZipA
MANLRWILLAAGAALLLLLLVVGLMRGRQTARASEQRNLLRLDDSAAREPQPDASDAPSPPGEPESPASEVASIADWPPASERCICSLRVMGLSQDRLSGRRVRHGLESAGFVHGELAIFHLPGRRDRAMLSAASLSQPGLLDPALMDYQRFAGMHIFTVLPGRVPAEIALEQLYAVTAELARRVEGRVHDDSGRLLDPARVDAWLKQQLQLAAAPRGVAGAAAAAG